MSLAAILGGWALCTNRPAHDTRVGIAVLIAMILVSGATLFAVSKNHERQMEQNRREREQQEREVQERDQREQEERKRMEWVAPTR
jgi:predicted metalloprotease